MDFIFNFIVWSPDPEIFSIGSLSVRWYGLLFALGFLIGQQILIHIYKSEGREEKHVEVLTIYMVIATIIGARLGHCLFYEPDYYLSNPIEILYIWQGGLASHGATVGILLALFLYSRKHTDQSYLYVLDRMVITIALAGCLIRTGNLMNSEIIGEPTNVAWGFVFAREGEDGLEKEFGDTFEDFEIVSSKKDTSIAGYDRQGLKILMSNPQQKIDSLDLFVNYGIREVINQEASSHIVLPEKIKPFVVKDGDEKKIGISAWGIPRHPAQLYEAISALLLFFLLFAIWKKHKARLPEGRIFGLFCLILFSFRILFEFLKEPQVDFERTMVLNMGQLLSIPMVLVGLFIFMRSMKKRNEII